MSTLGFEMVRRLDDKRQDEARARESELCCRLRELRAIVLMWQRTGVIKFKFGTYVTDLMSEIDELVGPPSEEER